MFASPERADQTRRGGSFTRPRASRSQGLRVPNQLRTLSQQSTFWKALRSEIANSTSAWTPASELGRPVVSECALAAVERSLVSPVLTNKPSSNHVPGCLNWHFAVRQKSTFVRIHWYHPITSRHYLAPAIPSAK